MPPVIPAPRGRPRPHVFASVCGHALSRPSAAPRFRDHPRPRAFVAARGAMLSQPSAILHARTHPQPQAPATARVPPLPRGRPQLRALAAVCNPVLSRLPAASRSDERSQPPGGPPAPYPEAVAPSSLLGRIAALSPSPRRTPPILPSQRFGPTASFCEICIDLNPAPKQIYAYRSKMRS